MSNIKLITPTQVLNRLLIGLVEHPDNLVLKTKCTFDTVVVSIQAHRADTPRLIGSKASMYLAIEVLTKALFAKSGFTAYVPSIREPVTGEPERYVFQHRADWPREQIQRMVESTAQAIFQCEECVDVQMTDDYESKVTLVEIAVSTAESVELISRVAPALRTVFDAIGRAKGRVLILSVSAVNMVQPGTEKGRFS